MLTIVDGCFGKAGSRARCVWVLAVKGKPKFEGHTGSGRPNCYGDSDRGAMGLIMDDGMMEWWDGGTVGQRDVGRWDVGCVLEKKQSEWHGAREQV